MGRRRRMLQRKMDRAKKAQMRIKLEAHKPQELKTDIRMISGCEDDQTSADVSNVNSFKLPDPAGRAGGACTAALLNVLYKDNETPDEDYSFIEVLGKMRDMLQKKGFSQIPQLTATSPLDLSDKFDLVPASATGTHRALMIGINYVGHASGELSGCHNDVGNMKNYIKKVHGFEEQNITILMDDGKHESPTKKNMIAGYKKIVSECKAGDALFLHYSGHGAKILDDDVDEEEDGYDEVLVPLDYQKKGMIRDDDLYEIIVKGMPAGVHVVCLMDCCHSGTVLDLPYKFLPNGEVEEMEIDDGFDFKKKLSSGVNSLLGL
jgi:hypothetical protein